MTPLLWWLTAGVIAAGLCAVVVQPLALGLGSTVAAWLVATHVSMVALASAATVRMRLRSAVAGTAWTDSAILICIVSLPAGWVAPVVFAGVLLGKLATRVSPY